MRRKLLSKTNIQGEGNGGLGGHVQNRKRNGIRCCKRHVRKVFQGQSASSYVVHASEKSSRIRRENQQFGG